MAIVKLPKVALMSTCDTDAGVHSAQACSVWVCYVDSRSAIPHDSLAITKKNLQTINLR